MTRFIKSFFLFTSFFAAYSFSHPMGDTLYIEIFEQKSQDGGLNYEVKTYFPVSILEDIYKKEEKYKNRPVIEIQLPNVQKKTDEKEFQNAKVTTDDGQVLDIKDYGFSKLTVSHYLLSESVYGKSLKLDYPDKESLIVFIKITDQDGKVITLIPKEDEHIIEIPKQKVPTPKIVFNFIKVGIMHILEGFDHLLFIFCLTLIAGRRYGILFWTITGFTLSHSITLILTVLGFIQFFPPLIELGIALSILYLLIEILLRDKLRDLKPSFIYRFPAVVSTCFGFLHGMGFASALKEVGLPNEGLIPALLSFNVGVEIGQVLFVGFLYSLLALFSFPSIAKTFLKERSYFARRAISLFALVIALFWTYQRVLALFSSGGES